MKHLAAVNEKEKGMKSRLRRAFSFGSAAELRRASAENAVAAERARLRKDKYQTDEDAEQAAIIAKQEAAGIGAGIYSGQGGMGSNDNLSIQSAASSASIMLRKMGSGMKKGTRSIKVLFRPKSVIGVPAADGPVARPSVGQVSMVSVEAERQKVNVNANAHDQVRGGTGYPRLERNSIDAGRSAEIVNADGSLANDMARKSIVGGDRERAEILSNMKKGILKRKVTTCASICSSITNRVQATEPTQTLDRPPSDLLTDQTPHSLSMHRSLPPTRRARRIATTTSRNLRRSRMEARGASRSHQRLLEISPSAHAFSSTMHGHLTITTAEEISRHATG